MGIVDYKGTNSSDRCFAANDAGGLPGIHDSTSSCLHNPQPAPRPCRCSYAEEQPEEEDEGKEDGADGKQGKKKPLRIRDEAADDETEEQQPAAGSSAAAAGGSAAAEEEPKKEK